MVGVGRAGAAARRTVPAAAGARCCATGRSPGGECGAWSRRGPGGAWPGKGRAARPRPAAGDPERRAPSSSPSAAASERRWSVGRRDPLGVHDSLSPRAFSFKPLGSAFHAWELQVGKEPGRRCRACAARGSGLGMGGTRSFPPMSEPAGPVPEPREGGEAGGRFPSAAAGAHAQASPLGE